MESIFAREGQTERRGRIFLLEDGNERESPVWYHIMAHFNRLEEKQTKKSTNLDNLFVLTRYQEQQYFHFAPPVDVNDNELLAKTVIGT